MAKKTVHVEELQAKIIFLATDKIAMLLGKHNSEKSLLESIREGARTTVRSGYKTNRLNGDIEEALGQKCQFDLDNVWRLGTKNDFATSYHGRHGSLLNGSATVLQVARPALVLLQADFFAKTKCSTTRYAGLALRPGPSQPIPGEVVLGFDLNCPDDKSDGLSTALRRCILTFYCGCGRTTDFAMRTGYPGGVVFDGVRFIPLHPDFNEPSWLVEAVGDKPIGMVGSVPNTFLRIHHLTPGSNVRAKVHAYLKDIRTTFFLTATDPSTALIQRRLEDLRLTDAGADLTELASAEIYFAPVIACAVMESVPGSAK